MRLHSLIVCLAAGLLLAILYPLVVRETRLRADAEVQRARVSLTNIGALFSGRALKCAYVGSGLQLFVAGALPAWPALCDVMRGG